MRRLLALIIVALVSPAVLAGEGMWQPKQLPALGDELRSLGLKLDPQQLTDLTEHPMNAVISLGGCTASFVSPEGLVVTNHHCAYGAIQYNSTEESNLLEDGFLAARKQDELPAGPGSRVLVTVELTDVTGKIKEGLGADLSGGERYAAIEKREKELVAACEKDDGHRCNVYSFHGGLEYRLIKQLEIKDVRLVYAPPRGIGVYGGDIDNWMWPRHTGDFSFYRAYVGADGKPAEHHEDNVPYRPRHHLKVSDRGLKQDDFVMVAGYPGSTNRYRLAAEVASRIDWYYPTRKQVFGEWLDIIDTETADREEAAIKYASLVAGLNNAAKNYGGMLEGFAKSDVVARKQGLQEDLQTWIEANGERRELYASATRDLRTLVAESLGVRERDLFYDSLGRRAAPLVAARLLYRLAKEREKPDMEREPGYQERDEERIRERLTRMDRRYAPDVDRACWRHFILSYAAIPVDQHVKEFDDWFGIKGNEVDGAKLDSMLDDLYGSTTLGDKETRLGWMEKPAAAFESSKDPFIQLAVHLYPSDMALEKEEKDLLGRFQETRARYMAALIAFLGERGKAPYPDANGTLRVTYGTVSGSSPKDGLVYTPFTTLSGLLEKETGEEPFDSPPALLTSIREGRYGRFSDPALGSVPVNFLSTVDTTGGNSGSPTLNARGELVGLLFDGTYESIISDWDFIADKTRSIHVDMRYVLWIMDRFSGAQHLLKEMGI